MKVLFVTGEFPPLQGGVGDYTHEIGLALHRLGSQVHVVTSTRAGLAKPLTIHTDVERWNWTCWATILDLVRCQRPDILHVQYQTAAYGMHPAINLLPWRLRWLGGGRPRTAVTFHDLKVPYLFPKAGALRRWMVNELARRCDAAITTNRQDWDSLGQALGSPPALIPIGSNIARLLPAGYDREVWRARWGASPGDLLLCFFGFVNDRKGIDTLLFALRDLVTDPQGPSNPRLLMIGGQTGTSDPTNVGYLEEIYALIDGLSLGNRILWTGFVEPDEVSANFAAADICVLPFRDGVSFLHGTLHAALVHGMPIITTRPPVDLPEFVEGENVEFVPAEQPGALALAIKQLSAEGDLRRALGKGALALSREFRWDKIAADTLALYRTLCPGA